MGRFFLIILFLILLINMCWALEVKTYSTRDKLINLTLDTLQTKRREKAFKDAFMEAIIKLEEEEEESLTEIRKGEFFKKVLENLQYFVSHSLEYNDNIYSFKDKTSDTINSIEPRVKLKLSDIRIDMDFDLGIIANLYTHNSQYNNQEMDFNFKINRKANKYNLFFENSLLKEYVAPGEWGVNQQAFPTYWRETLRMGIQRRFNRLNFGFNYSFSIYDFESQYSYDRDRTEHYFRPSFHFRIAPKTYFFTDLGYNIVRHRYNSLRDYNSKNFNFGLDGLLTHKLRGTVWMGYRYEDHKIASDYKSVTTSGGLNYTLSKLTQLNLGFERQTYESSDVAQYYQIVNSFRFGLLHRFSFNPRVSFRFNTEFSYIDYPKMQEVSREDEIWSFGLGLGYRMRKWFEFGLDYKYKSRTSNVEYDYNNNIFTFTTTASF